MSVNKEKNVKKKRPQIIRYITDYISMRDGFLSAIILAILVFGSICIISASINAKTTRASIFAEGFKQLLVLGISGIAYFIAMFYQVKNAKRGTIRIFAIITILLLIAAYVCCKIQGDINNNYSWIYIKDVSFLRLQPSEIAKVMTILLVAVCLADREVNKKMSAVQLLTKPIVDFIIFILIIVVLQRDMGSALVVCAVGALTFLLLKDKRYRFGKVIVIIGLVAGCFLFTYFVTESGQEMLRNIGLTTIANRFEAMVNPDIHSDASREIFYSLLGISRGGITGVGIGESVQKFGYIAASETDYIFAIIVEEMGVIGIAAVFVLYFTLMIKLISSALKMESERERVFVCGTVIYLFVHFFLNVGGVSGLIPLTGVPLLLLSRGGSSLIAIMICLGLCQGCIIRNRKLKQKSSVQQIEEIRL